MVRDSYRFNSIASAFVLCSVLSSAPAAAGTIKTVFVIAMENTNWTQVANQFTGNQQQIFNNPAAPFLNGLVNGTLATTVNGQTITSQTAYATAYHNVLSTPTGANPSIHPSEPNYIWSEAGDNLGVLNDNTPYGAGGTHQSTTNHLTTLLSNGGKTWKSYQEEIDHVGTGAINQPGNNSLTNTLASPGQYTVPLTNFAGTSAAYTNPYNGSHQYDYAAKHNPMVFFDDTAGNGDQSSSNPMASHYAPLEQLQTDLGNNTVANYNWITPDQFNDMHTALSGGFTYKGTAYTGGAAKVAQGDNFLSIIVPIIMASQAYQNDGAIVLWWDESEPDGSGNQNDFNHTIPEIIISPDAHANVNGKPYASPTNYTHSADLRTMQEIFGVAGGGFLRDAANGPDLRDLLAADAIPTPEPATCTSLLIGLGLLGARRRARKKSVAAE